LEQSESAAEFLLNPWVLIQLPFQPVLFHQWTVALFAETLKFKNEINDFFTLPFSTRLKPAVDCLKNMEEILLSTGGLMIEVLFKYFEDPCVNLHNLSVICLNVALKKLPELLPVLEFVLDDECKNIVRALKRMAWNKTAKMSVEYEHRTGIGFDSRVIYSYGFWKQETAAKSLVTEPNGLMPANPYARKPMSTNERNRIIEGMKEVIDREIITTGRLKGESREKILNALSDDCMMIHLYDNYVANLGN